MAVPYGETLLDDLPVIERMQADWHREYEGYKAVESRFFCSTLF